MLKLSRLHGWWVALCIAGLVLGGCGPSSTPAATREDKWRQDLKVLATELPRRHKNLFFQMSKDEFERAVAQLDQQIPSLTDDAIMVNMARIVAMAGDAHTRLRLPESGRFHFYPLELYAFKDGWFVTRATTEYSRASGARLVKIGDTPVEQAYAAVSTVIPHENDAQVKNAAPLYLLMAETLYTLGILPGTDKGRFTFQNSMGETFTLELTSAELDSKPEWAPDPTTGSLPLYRQKPKLNYWFEYLADTQTLYVQYNACVGMKDKSFANFSREVLAFADTHPVKRFVVDLRRNDGGDSSLAQPLITGIKQRAALNQRGRLFVIVGRGTFSSAVLNALDFKNKTQAIFVGEPTGGKPNHYGEFEEFTLPHSRLRVGYSTKYFSYSQDDTPSFVPDVLVELSSADYFAGRDPVLEAILAYQEK